MISDTDFASYADDNSPYVIGKGIGEVIQLLEHGSFELFQWCNGNQMKANEDKSHFLTKTSLFKKRQ